MNHALPLALLALIAASCGTTPPGTAPEPDRRVGDVGDTSATLFPVAAGLTGPADSIDAADRWTTFRDFWFDSNRSELQAFATEQISDIANHVQRHPGQRVGIDGAIDPRRAELGNRRRISIRDALLRAGVPADRIEAGDFGNPQLRRDLRVEVLISER